MNLTDNQKIVVSITAALGSIGLVYTILEIIYQPTLNQLSANPEVSRAVAQKIALSYTMDIVIISLSGIIFTSLTVKSILDFLDSEGERDGF